MPYPERWWVREREIPSSYVSEISDFPVAALGLAEQRTVTGKDLRRLFQSRGAQRALNLPVKRSASAAQIVRR
jgi:hypothetical protein